MKRALPWIALALALMLGIAVCDGLRTRDGYSVIIGQKDEAIKVRDKVIVEKDKAIIEANAAKKKAQDELVGTVQDLTQAQANVIKAKKDAIAAKVESDKLKTEVQPVIDANPKLKAFVEGLEARLDQQDVIIADQGATIDKLGMPVLTGFANGIPQFTFPEGSITGNLHALVVQEVQISEAWKIKYEAEHRVLSLSEKALQLSNRKLKTSQIVSNLKTGALLTAAVLVGVNALKGK